MSVKITRESILRSDSATSTLSCITVENDALVSTMESSSTPPTSVTDSGSISSKAIQKEEEPSTPIRARRSRASLVNYNENALAGTARKPARRRTVRGAAGNNSEETLVPSFDVKARQLVEESIQVLDLDWTVDAMPGDKPAIAEPTRRSFRKRMSVDMEVLTKASSALGKRTRGAFDAGLGKLQDLGKRASLRPRIKPESEVAVFDGPANKKVKVSTPESTIKVDTSPETVQKPIKAPTTKRWLSHGLYLGQDPGFDPRLTNAKNKLKRAGTSETYSTQRKILPFPMFAGKRLIENGKGFQLPWDVFSPLPRGQPKPEEWRKTQKNVFVGDAADIWKHSKKMEYSACICTPETGCDEDCFNRFMFYECDGSNCNVGPEHCKNRSFEELRKRCKAGGKYRVGVEVIKTKDRGYGVRSNRTFEPNQIIVEYTGEIITQDECDRRMRKEYKNNECFYLMIFDQNMIIDATRGSIARFVNHSCEPNCKMVKWTVAGKPRMALFAGDQGIMTGEELTYDYNFDPFSSKNIQECRCGKPSCRGVLGPKPKDREIKEALKPLTETGTKRKFQQAIQDTVNAVANKRRKIAVPKSLKNAAKAVKSQAMKQLTKARALSASNDEKARIVKKVSERSLRQVSRAKTKTTTVKFRTRTLKNAVPDAKNRPTSRSSVGRVDSKRVRRNVVQTIKGASRGGRVGKSIRVISSD